MCPFPQSLVLRVRVKFQRSTKYFQLRVPHGSQSQHHLIHVFFLHLLRLSGGHSHGSVRYSNGLWNLFCFSDLGLRMGLVEINTLGWPHPTVSSPADRSLTSMLSEMTWMDVIPDPVRLIREVNSGGYSQEIHQKPRQCIDKGQTLLGAHSV